MRNATVLVFLATAAITAALGSSWPGETGADDFEINRSTIDGGGDMWSTGGDFELGGTVGQPDANAAAMTGGDFELSRKGPIPGE